MEQAQEASAAARPNGGRPLKQLVVSKEGRKPLFSTSSSNTRHEIGAQKKDLNPQAKSFADRSRISSGFGERLDAARRTNSESHVPLVRRESSANTSTPPGSASRIPQLTTNNTFAHRRQLSLAEAYRLAEDEEAVPGGDDREDPPDASPSPAPRPWRSRREQDDNNMREALAEDPLDAKSRQKQGARAKLNAETAIEIEDSQPDQGPSWQSRVGDWQDQEKGRGLNGGPAIPDLVPGIEDVPLPSVESPEKPRRPSENPSPEKSFAWQVDEDFTAGDLQVSDSPRIKTNPQPFANRLQFDDNSEVDIHSRTRVNNPGSQNTKLDEIRNREVKSGSNIPVERPLSRTRNTKLDEIRARESEAEKIPIPDRRLSGTQNTKLEEIRQREIQGLSKRQSASARLQEIREQNSLARSASSDETRPTSRRETAQPSSPGLENKANRMPESPSQRGFPSTGGERIPNTPVTIFKNRRKENDPIRDEGTGREGSNDAKDTSKLPTNHRRADSRDLLQKLARAASSSPAAAAETVPKKGGLARRSEKTTDSSALPPRPARRALTSTTGTSRRRGNKTGNENGGAKPTVEFAGLRRVRSTESTRSKRSSLNSEMDPTDRIEAEMKLFAPLDNHSEKGSVRAPSPAVDPKDDTDDEAEVEATPKPKKEDPLTMPTPKVTGAYVETPATVRVIKVEDAGGDEPPPKQQPGETKHSAPQTLAELRDKLQGPSRRSIDRDAASDPGADSERSSSSKLAAVLPKRARSLSRQRLPLKNSARLPSVRDDLKELQRLHNIEDSTVDDFDEILVGIKRPSPNLAAALKHLPSETEEDETYTDDDEKVKNSDDTDAWDRELDPIELSMQLGEGNAMPTSNKLRQRRVSAPGDLAAFDRMSKSLQTGLLGIRSAKQGIERLEGNLAHTAKQLLPKGLDVGTRAAGEHTHNDPDHQSKACPTCTNQPSQSFLATLLPSFASRSTSRPVQSFLAIVSFISLALSIWFVAESTMCAFYCRPQTCVSPPCVWSYDDPTLGTALPVKLDDWITGGAGRALFNDAAEEVEDYIADILDAALGRDITEVDINTLSFEGKRAHRRRLRKKGLDKASRAKENASPEVLARWDAWHQERLAREKARDEREMGYLGSRREDEASIGGDERIG